MFHNLQGDGLQGKTMSRSGGMYGLGWQSVNGSPEYEKNQLNEFQVNKQLKLPINSGGQLHIGEWLTTRQIAKI